MKNKPREIRWVIYCLIILIAMNVLSLGIMLGLNDDISEGLIQSLQLRLPDISVDNIQTVVSDILINRNLFHLVVIICWSALAYLVYKGKSWARFFLVIFTLLSFVGSVYAYSTTQFLSLQILAALGWLGRIILLWLLLIPSASREYFRSARLVEGSRI